MLNCQFSWKMSRWIVQATGVPFNGYHDFEMVLRSWLVEIYRQTHMEFFIHWFARRAMQSSSYLRSPQFSSEIALFDTSSTLPRVSCNKSEQECSEIALSAPSKVVYHLTWYCLVLVHQRHIHNSEAFRSYIHQFFQCVLGVNTMLNETDLLTGSCLI